LVAVGLRIGDRVAVSSRNGLDIVVAFLATMHVGAVWVGVNRVLAPREKIELLADSGARALLASDPVVAEIGAARAELPDLELVTSLAAWTRAAESVEPIPAVVDLDPGAPAAIAYTSGTTGRPKGVVHSQRNMLLPGVVAARRREPFRNQLTVHPATILNIMVVDILSGLRQGMTNTVMDWSGAANVAAAIQRDRVETARLAPPMAYDLIGSNEIPEGALSSLVNPVVGGAELPEAFVALFTERFGTPPRGAYGLTEAMNGVARELADEPHREGCSGPAYEHLKLTVRDADNIALAPGEVGELCVEAATDGELAGVWTPMLGYWQRPDETREALRDGMLHTGDLACLDVDGRLYIRGRLKEVIVRGGANVYPAEVERVLATHPGVAESAVLGVADERLGQQVAAVARRSPGMDVTESELIEHCRRLLAAYKCPVVVRFVDEMPRTSAGKLAKRDLVGLFDVGDDLIDPVTASTTGVDTHAQ
jgi:acyl-CoA synthetase (AMP-forming)/AMP-acid ligase II